MSDYGILQARVNLGWADEYEKRLLASLQAEEKFNLQEHLRLSKGFQEEREAKQPKGWKQPSWMRAMGPDDYIRHHRVCQERESFAEQRERVMRTKS